MTEKLLNLLSLVGPLEHTVFGVPCTVKKVKNHLGATQFPGDVDRYMKKEFGGYAGAVR